ISVQDKVLSSTPSEKTGVKQKSLTDFVTIRPADKIIVPEKSIWPSKEILADIYLNFSLLSEGERKLMNRAAKELAIKKLDQLSLANVVYDWKPARPNAVILGRKLFEVYEEFKDKVYPYLETVVDKSDEELSESLTEPSLLRVDRLFVLPSIVVDKILSNDLTSFVDSCDDRTKEIVLSRFGIDGNPAVTLEEIGQRFGITRERIRQLEAKAIALLKLSLSLTSTVIRQNVKQNLTHEFQELYPSLAGRFEREKDLFLFMEHITDANKNELRDVVYPNFKVDVIEEWFAYNLAPMSTETAVELLMEQYGCNARQALNAIYQLSNEEKINFQSGNITPKGLGKIAAAAQAALAFPDGVNFRDIHKLANEQGFCNTQFPLDRQEHGIQGGVEQGLLYLSGHGSYRHTNFFPLDEKQVEHIVKQVKEILAVQTQGTDSLHLKMNVYEQSPALREFDYFDVRHVAREFGEQFGVYFAGKSGADTVSLKSDVTPTGQQQAILKWFTTDKTPRTRDEVAKIIRSGSVNHASFYINELVTEGKLVRIDLTHYTTPEYAFEGAPIKEIMDISVRYIKYSDRPIEIGMIANKCNALLHLEKPKVWYLSMLRQFAKNFGLELYTYHNLISNKPLDGLSIHSILKPAMQITDERSELVDIVKKKIDVEESAIHAAIHHLRTTQRTHSY
ncbi:hypothetical protein H4F28_18185, partial [Vibrio alginolyticus]|nr:hypothetical protein [Vibrio parahaemolyticus]EIE7518595.1 hypothetical protein [Vibrio parahaemolyticus]EJG1426925.1 hypothetical protein [Vibrio parahaemolyticus]EME0902595.1 hypothetical protein [Vibrio parahaemolyticus]HCG6641774.1 hypothetical protein [Vibrio parahaemolyticus]